TGLEKKPEETKAPATTALEQKKPEPSSTSRTSFPIDPPGATLPSAPSNSTPPTIALDFMGKNTTPPADAKKPEEKKPAESVVKPDAPASNNTQPAITPPSATGSTLPTPPNGGAITMSDLPKQNTTTPEKKSDELPQPP